MFLYVTCKLTTLCFDSLILLKQKVLSESNQRTVSVPVTQSNFSLVLLHVSIQKPKRQLFTPRCDEPIPACVRVCVRNRKAAALSASSNVTSTLSSSANCMIHYDTYHSSGRWLIAWFTMIRITRMVDG